MVHIPLIQYSNPSNKSSDENKSGKAKTTSSKVSSRGQLDEVHHLDLDNFKIKPCIYEYTHNHKKCPFFHNERDKRREGSFYSPQLCEFAEKNMKCAKRDQCRNSHNSVEQLFRDEKYKTKYCSFYPDHLDSCDYGKYCCFAHSEEDIKIELIHNFTFDNDFFMFKYKTVWCPFNIKSHEKSKCVYAHNWQDFRRKPNHYNYDPTACSQWKTTDFIVNYENGCEKGLNCDKSHGWKEAEYHPLFYKTKPCSKCIKGPDCPYYHSNSDKRTLSKGVNFQIFKIVPKNRNTKVKAIPSQYYKETTDCEDLFRNTSESSNFKDQISSPELEINVNNFKKRLSSQQGNALAPILEKVDRRHSANEAGNLKTRLFGVAFGRLDSMDGKIKEANSEDEGHSSDGDDSFIE